MRIGRDDAEPIALIAFMALVGAALGLGIAWAATSSLGCGLAALGCLAVAMCIGWIMNASL